MMPSFGFKIISSDIEYKNPFMKIYKHKIENPDGKVSDYWVVSKKDYSISIPILPGGYTLLVGQYRLPANYYSWEFPMGYAAGLKPVDMAGQELREETGFEAKKWDKIGYFYAANGWSTQGTNVYVASDLVKGKRTPEQTEFLRIKKIQINAIEKMIVSEKIKDGPTIIAFYFLKNYLNNQKI